MGVDVHEHARCLTCGYSLRDLTDFRCPECGRAFNPNDAASMNVQRSRADVWLARPLGQTVLWFQAISIAALVWGFALLPGGLTLGFLGMTCALGCYAFRCLHSLLQMARLSRYGAIPPLTAPSRTWRRIMRVLLLLVALTIFDLPMQMNGLLTRSAANCCSLVDCG